MKKSKPATRSKRATLKSIAPTYDLSSLPGYDDTTRVELPNGIVVIARENFTSPAVVFNGSLRVGSLNVSREKAGLSSFVASSLMRGTQTRNFSEIYETIESIGARLGMSGGTHTTGFSGKALAEDVDLLLAMAADSLRRPSFPHEHVEKLRGEYMTRLAMREHDTGSVASLHFDELLYPDHPYSVDDSGYPETIAALTRDEAIKFHEMHYGPRGTTLVIVGAIKAARAVELAQQHFGDWANPHQSPAADVPPVAALTEVRRRDIAIAGKSQADIVMGCVGPRRNDPDYLDARMANNVFGVFGMAGRLGDVVREKHGLAYYAYSQLTGGMGPGPWQIVAGVNPKNVEFAIELIGREIKRLTTTKITAAELDENKANFIGRVPLQLETNEGVAATLESMELYRLGLDFLRRYPSLVNAITRESVLAAAQKYLNADAYAVAVAGPKGAV